MGGTGSEGGRAARAARLASKAVAWLVVVAVPTLGVWAGSSLAVYLDQPVAVALAAGALAFPGLPLAWEGVAALRRARQEAPRRRILTLGDRIVLRTFALNFTLLALFLAVRPVAIFEALATRGDWMLQGRTDPTSERIRGALLATADAMAWLYEAAAEDNPYEEAEDEPPPPPPPPDERLDDGVDPRPPAPDGDADGDREGDEPARDDPQGGAPQDEEEEPHRRAARERGEGPPAWPLPDVLHPAVTALTPAQEASIEAVGRALAEAEPDPYLRVKALHDYVADRVAYDAPLLALPPSRWPSQRAAAVFASRRAVCSGYARLMVALGEVTGDRIVYIVGDSREMDGSISGTGHAWNAVEIEGRWFLMDVTWDAGSVNGDTFEKRYGSDYFLTPAELFSLDHLPDEPRWQLRPDPVSRGEFARQPRLKPGFFRAGLRLVDPNRSHVTARGAFVARLDNPAERFVLAQIQAAGVGGDGERCEVSGGPRTEVRCALPREGTYDVLLFESPQRYGTYWDVAAFRVVGGP